MTVKVNYIFIVLMFISYLHCWQGDSAIYQVYAKNISEGKGLVFNDEYSTGATSPLWAGVLSLGYMTDPLIFNKVLSLIFLLGFAYLFNEFGILTAGILFFITKPAMYGYELGMFFFFVGVLWYGIKNKNAFVYAAWVLIPFVRPEGILLLIASLFLYRDKRLIFALIPYFLYLAFNYFYTGFFQTSSAGRWQYLLSEGELFSRRYWFWALPVIAYLLKNIKFNKYAYALTLLLLIPLWDSTRAVNRYNFNEATQKGIENHISVGKILTMEVPIKYWLPKAEVISMDGITDGKVLGKDVNEFIEQEDFDYIVYCGTLRESDVNFTDYEVVSENKNKINHCTWEKIYKHKLIGVK